METLRRIREEQYKMNQTDFARMVGIDRETYCKYENDRKSIGLVALKKIYLRLKKDDLTLNMQDILDME